MTTQDIKPKSKLLYLTLAVPVLGASVAFAFGDPQCLADLTDGQETTDASDTGELTSTSEPSTTTVDLTSATGTAR